MNDTPDASTLPTHRDGELEGSEEDLRYAVEAGGFGVWRFDLATRDLFTSRVCRANFGRDPEQPFTYNDLLGAVYPDDVERIVSAIDWSVETGVGLDVEYRVRTPAGELRWIHAWASPNLGSDGRALMAGVALNVTGRKVQEVRRLALVELGDRIRDADDADELAYAAAEILGRALDVSRAGYGTIDTAAETFTVVRDWNAPGVRTLAGVLHFRDYGSYIEDLKRGDTVVFADAETDPRTTATADVLKAISAQSAINMPVTERGGFVAMLYLNNATPRAWPDDELAFVREVADRTRTAVARLEAEHSLRELASSLERQVEERTLERDRVWTNSRDLLAVIGADGVFRAANPAWTTILGYETSEIVGRRFHAFVCPEDVELTQQALDTAAARTDLTNFENRYRHKDGAPRWISWRTSTEGDLVYAYGRHITVEKDQQDALERAEEQLRQSQKMEAVGQLTGGLAHDFNNLLAGIMGSLELIQTRISQGRISEIDRYANAAQSASKRAAALTHRLLAFSRRQTLDPKLTDTNRLVGGMEEMVRRTVGPHVEVTVVGAGGLWPVLVDRNQLENALLNLCINARDAMPDGGRLTIETSNRWLDERGARERDLPPGQYVSLCVSDTGQGMSPEVAERAFDPFFTTKPIGLGTGLGLSMIYGFTRQSGGQARIYSEVGQGTTVCLYLPRQAGTEDQSDLVQAPLDPDRSDMNATVLVVDDEPIVRMLVTDVLTDLGCTILEAADGTAALKILQSDVALDLLVTDVGLPGGMNGRQVADAARQARPQLGVLFVTGFAENALLGDGLLEPGMQVITKPFTVGDLSNRVEDLLKARS